VRSANGYKDPVADYSENSTALGNHPSITKTAAQLAAINRVKMHRKRSGQKMQTVASDERPPAGKNGFSKPPTGSGIPPFI